MKMMLNDQIRAEDPVLRRVYDHFARNLSDILSTATRAGAQPIVCSVSSNLKDCPPFASLNRLGLSGVQKAQWESLMSSGSDLEVSGDSVQALAKYRQAAEIDNTYAALAFRMARCYFTLGQVAAAGDEYARARDLDALRFRADTSINKIIRRICASRAAEGVRFFDSELVMTNACEQGILGEECLWDHVHFNFAGNYLLARGLSDQVLALLPESVRRSAESGERVLTVDQCAERLAFTDWDQRSVVTEMLRRAQEPPFTAQLDHASLIQRRSLLAAELDRKLGADGLAKAVGIYHAALARRTDDWLLHHRLAFLLETTGDYAGAAEHWRTVTQMVPECVEAWFKLGETCARLGRPLDAEVYYQRVLELRPTSFEAMNGLGLLQMDKGKLDEAARLFEQALKINPKFAQIHVNWGLLEARRGVLTAAEGHYREALRSDPDSTAAHINLANLLAAQQKHSEAIDHYLQALKFRPNESTIHFGLANSLAAVGRDSESVSQYRQTTQLDPPLADAHFNLGVALAKQGNLPAATASFQEACRLHPDDPQAHLNLGVALARQNRWREATDQFEAVVRLDPGNAAAGQYLQAAKARERPGP